MTVIDPAGALNAAALDPSSSIDSDSVDSDSIDFEKSAVVTETAPEAPEADLVADDPAAQTQEDATASDAESSTLPVVVPTVHLAVNRPVQTVGRRKEAIARVRLMPGTGVFTINGRTLDSYFPNKVHQQLLKEPLVDLEKDGIYDVIASISGGGVTGQAGALRLGIARALIELDVTDRPAMKKAGFLTRDARVKERKKYGLKKARKAPQYSKR